MLDAWSQQSRINMKSQSMKLIEFTWELNQKYAKFVIGFALELIKEHIQRMSVNPETLGISPNALKYMGEAAVAKSKLIRAFWNSNFILWSNSEELLDVALQLLSSLSYILVKYDNFKNLLVKLVYKLGPIIMDNGSKLIQSRFILFLGYYFDIILNTKISKSLLLKSPENWKERLVIFEESINEQISNEMGQNKGKSIKLYKNEDVLQGIINTCKTTNELNNYFYLIFLCTWWFSKTALAYQAIDTLRSIISDKNLQSYLVRIIPYVVEILVQTEITSLCKYIIFLT